MQTQTIPSHWSKFPEWIKDNEWLIQSQNHLFVKRLINTLSQLQMDQAIKSPGQKPMEATKECFMGDEAAQSIRFQYSEALKELNTLAGDDATEAKNVLEKFKDDFKEYLPFLEQGVI